ncbi:MAG: hypothetical protein AAFO04_28485 [Cyanobacteria bacterium J06592_8]
MKQQNLSESAAIVEIVKQFFEGTPEPQPELKVTIEEIVTEKLAETQTEISTLKTQMAQMQQLLAEAKSGKSPRKSRSQSTQLKVQPLTPEQLAKRLGVTVEVLEQEYAKGDVNFRIWMTNRGTTILWQKQGDLYHPLK